jgi:hypothetical protein
MPLRLWHKVLLFIGALTVIGAVTGGALYYACPVQVSILAALTRNCIVTLSAPAGTTRIEFRLQNRQCSGGAAFLRGVIAGRRLAELQQNADLGAFLAPQPD